MKITRVEVENFGCLLRGRVDLGPGLNILYGPNDLGKSTLIRAIRAALLLPHTSSEGKKFAPWESDEDPVVKVTLGLPSGRFWQVEKRFANPGASLLRESNDGVTFNSPFKKAREVDAELREKLAWGVASPATKGIKRGLPVSFLSTVLLGEQANVTDVLRTTLDSDTDESGRARLTAALSAFAQDPLFKKMLDTAQSKVDEAFTATGKRKRGASSPFVTASEHVKKAKAALVLLQKSAEESDGAIRELAEKNEVRAERQDALADFVTALKTVEELLAQQAERLAVEKSLGEAQETAQAAQQNVDEFKKRESDLVAIREKAVALSEVKRASSEKLGQAQQDLRTAEEALALAQSQEAEQARTIRRGQLEKQQLEHASSAKSLEDERSVMERARKLHGERSEHEAAFEALAEREEQASKTSEESKLAKTRAESALGDVDLARRLRQVRDVEAELASLKQAQAKAKERAAAAEAARAAETKARRRLREDLPSSAELTSMRALITQRDLAEARLGGGMAVSVELLKAVEVQGSADGEPLAGATKDTLRFDVEREFALSIGDVARVKVSAGSPEAREAVRDLQARVESEIHPVLNRLAAADLAGLSMLVDANATLLRECEKLASEAQTLEAIGDAQGGDLSKLETLPGRLESLLKDIAGTPTDAAEAVLVELGDGSLEGRESELRAKAKEAGERFEEARATKRDAETERQLLQQRADSTNATLAELGVDVPADGWEAAESHMKARFEELTAKRQVVESELAGLNSEQAAAVSALEAGVVAAGSSLEEAKARLEETTAALGELEKQAATLEGEINISRPAMESVDVNALEARVSEVQATLNAMPAPEEVVGGEDKEQALADVAAAKREHEQARDDVRKAEGRLQTVSGQVVVEETERAQEALSLAEQTEREIEVDYDGWNLLVQKLRSAENTEGQHLGEALSQPVSKRFAELTGDRYSKLEVLPTLGAEGIRVSGMLRGVDALSVGTQEQLATLLRLTIAEQLGATLILDDHLTQTDPGRIEWFRRVFRAHASEAQLVVMTCHPLDYLNESEMPTEGEAVARSASGLVHAIDVSKCVERSGSSR